MLAVIADEDHFFKAGWWPGHDAAKGKIMAFTYKDNNKNLTVFANDLTNDDHPQHQYRLLAHLHCGSRLHFSCPASHRFDDGAFSVFPGPALKIEFASNRY